MQKRARLSLWLAPLAILIAASAQVAYTSWNDPAFAAPSEQAGPPRQEEGPGADDRARLLKAHITCLQSQLRRLALTTSASPKEVAETALSFCKKTEEDYYAFRASRGLAGLDTAFRQRLVDELKSELREPYLNEAASIVEAARAQKPRIDAERTRLKQVWFEKCLEDNPEQSRQAPGHANNLSPFCSCMSGQLSESIDDHKIAYGWTVGVIRKAMFDAHAICKPRFFGEGR
jgi:hypothetical protein